MRRLCLFVVLLGSLLVTAIPAHADASNKYQFKSRGSSASAYFTTLPSGGALPDTIYTDTMVFAAHDATTADGTRYQDDVAFVSQFSYKLGDGGWPIPVASTSGFAHGEDVALTTSGNLTTATVSADVAMTRCDLSTWFCSDAGVSAVNVNWTGEGAVSRGVSVSNWASGFSRYVSRYSGSYRAASAGGTLGSDSLGASNWASLSDTSSMSLSICQGC